MVNVVSPDDYMRGSLPGEMLPFWEFEAPEIRAQIITDYGVDIGFFVSMGFNERSGGRPDLGRDPRQHSIGRPQRRAVPTQHARPAQHARADDALLAPRVHLLRPPDLYPVTRPTAAPTE